MKISDEVQCAETNTLAANRDGMNPLNRPIAILLILLIGHAPLPWAHTHAGLTGQELARHLQVFHPKSNQTDLPEGWHWHISIPKFEDSADDQKMLVVTENAVASNLLDDNSCVSSEADTARFGWSELYHCCVHRPPTYLRLGRLLI